MNHVYLYHTLHTLKSVTTNLDMQIHVHLYICHPRGFHVQTHTFTHAHTHLKVYTHTFAHTSTHANIVTNMHASSKVPTPVNSTGDKHKQTKKKKTHTYRSTHAHAHAHARTQTRTRAHTRSTHAHARTRARAHARARARARTHTHTHTHTHTPFGKLPMIFSSTGDSAPIALIISVFVLCVGGGQERRLEVLGTCSLFLSEICST